MKKLIISTLLSLLSFPLLASTGKIIILHGEVEFSTDGAKFAKAARNQKVAQGTILKTGAKSFVKIIMEDKTQLSLGPKGSFKVEATKPADPSMVSLLKGQLRSAVQKDPLAEGEGKTKFIIQTKTASMGIRGTELMTTYNPENNVTNLITFTGEVAMATKEEVAKAPDIHKFFKENAVKVKEGRFSSINPMLGNKATVPTKLSPAQFSALKSADHAKSADSKKTSDTPAVKTVRSLVPPGVAAKEFTTGNDGLNAAIGTSAVDAMKAQVDVNGNGGPPPEGFVDKATGTVAPPAGGFVDLNTGLYVPPPPGSTFDANTGVYVPPPTVGGFDTASGEYKPPAGLELTSDGKFVEATPEVTTAAPSVKMSEPLVGSVGEAIPAPKEEPISSAPPLVMLDTENIGVDVFDVAPVEVDEIVVDEYNPDDFAVDEAIDVLTDEVAEEVQDDLEVELPASTQTTFSIKVE